LWTAEDVFALSSSSKYCDPSKATTTASWKGKSVLTGECQERQSLGWTGGYDIHEEFKRLKFDDSLWYWFQLIVLPRANAVGL
jgi:hypothetical protein